MHPNIGIEKVQWVSFFALDVKDSPLFLSVVIMNIAKDVKKNES
jgi:hypothetical protein